MNNQAVQASESRATDPAASKARSYTSELSLSAAAAARFFLSAIATPRASSLTIDAKALTRSLPGDCGGGTSAQLAPGFCALGDDGAASAVGDCTEGSEAAFCRGGGFVFFAFGMPILPLRIRPMLSSDPVQRTQSRVSGWWFELH